MRIRAFVLAALAALLPVPSHAAPVPPCAGDVEISGAILLRVEKNGSVIFADGRAAHLEGILLPGGAADHAPQSFADQALGALTAMARVGPLTLTAVPPKEDRYDRIRGQLLNARAWVQAELLLHGLARVMIAPDRTECAQQLFALEAKARAAKAGIWSNAAYIVRAPEALRKDIGTFQIVEGKVLNVSLRNGRAYLNFGTDWKTDFTATVDHEDMKNFHQTGVDPRAYVGQTIRVRGLVQWLNGPEIEVANPQSVEVVQ
ncbi:MAG: thermonuclease family protein [Alphaproteobacteria bacterium]|nr:thermonuclease family protein [Alphaproteobacteria bacterium]MBL7098576.1 thermonuclease family protein [Alphaproteobacteria bacterium]